MFKLDKKILFFLSIFLIFGTILFYAAVPKTAFAWTPFSLEEIARDAIKGAVQSFLNLLTKLILKPIIWVLAHFIAFAININNQLFSPNNAFIQDGWRVSRDVANLGFVLIIIIIAFATILRIESYGIKKTLAKLIIVALLVNFSMMICAAIFDIANIFMKTFIDRLGDADGVANKLAEVFGVSNVANPTDQTGIETGAQEIGQKFAQIDAGSSLANLTTGPIFIVIFFVIIIITLAVLFIMLLIRYVWLGLLIILSPLAWLCSILPATANWWKTWWNHFLRWIIFAPAMTFFLYLALSSSGSIASLAGNAGSSSFGATFGSTIGNLFIMTGLLLGGLIVSNSLSLAGASGIIAGAIAVGSGIAGGTILWGARLGARGAGKLAATRPVGGRAMKMATQGRNKLSRAIGKGLVNIGSYATAFGRGVTKTGEAAPTTLLGAMINRTKYFRQHPISKIKKKEK